MALAADIDAPVQLFFVVVLTEMGATMHFPRDQVMESQCALTLTERTDTLFFALGHDCNITTIHPAGVFIVSGINTRIKTVMSSGQTMTLDGGLGRELERRGAPFRQPEWSALAMMEAPEIVRAVHNGYIRSGAQLITTNRYCVTI